MNLVYSQKLEKQNSSGQVHAIQVSKQKGMYILQRLPQTLVPLHRLVQHLFSTKKRHRSRIDSNTQYHNFLQLKKIDLILVYCHCLTCFHSCRNRNFSKPPTKKRTSLMHCYWECFPCTKRSFTKVIFYENPFPAPEKIATRALKLRPLHRFIYISLFAANVSGAKIDWSSSKPTWPQSRLQLVRISNLALKVAQMPIAHCRSHIANSQSKAQFNHRSVPLKPIYFLDFITLAI